MRNPLVITRCPWPTAGDPLYLAYHDDEWGVEEVVVYAHMQAVGMVNDHTVGCFRRSPRCNE